MVFHEKIFISLKIDMQFWLASIWTFWFASLNSKFSLFANVFSSFIRLASSVAFWLCIWKYVVCVCVFVNGCNRKSFATENFSKGHSFSYFVYCFAKSANACFVCHIWLSTHSIEIFSFMRKILQFQIITFPSSAFLLWFAKQNSQ